MMLFFETGDNTQEPYRNEFGSYLTPGDESENETS